MMSTCPSERAGSIQSIDKDAVHRICSGQVVVDLATAVKELVENSLDAGSTTVDVRLRDHGATLIEVSDNGKGIAAVDYAGITRKHCTSKLKDFSDLAAVETFGFRGEALSSLCAVGEVSITTRQACDAVGTKLVYDHRGEVVSQAACARETGTTVIVQKLFSTLPVRHKQLQKNVKREYARLLHVMQAYCLISQHARIHCSNQTGEKGQRHIVVASATNKPSSQRRPPGESPLADATPPRSAVGLPGNSPPVRDAKTVGVASDETESAVNTPATDGSEQAGDSSSETAAAASVACLRQNVASVYGTKQLSSLLVFRQCSRGDVLEQLRDDGLAESSMPSAAVVDQFSVQGLISDCQHGQGRSTPDRQFFYVNDRPWDGSRAAKVVNEVYHSYNRHQSPFVLLLVSVSERSSVDVNLTPDKRSMLLEHEKVFLALLKRSLAQLFRSREGCFGVDTKPSASLQPQAFNTATGSSSSSSTSLPGSRKPSWTVESLKRRLADAQASEHERGRSAKQPRLSAFGFDVARTAVHSGPDTVATDCSPQPPVFPGAAADAPVESEAPHCSVPWDAAVETVGVKTAGSGRLPAVSSPASLGPVESRAHSQSPAICRSVDRHDDDDVHANAGSTLSAIANDDDGAQSPALDVQNTEQDENELFKDGHAQHDTPMLDQPEHASIAALQSAGTSVEQGERFPPVATSSRTNPSQDYDGTSPDGCAADDNEPSEMTSSLDLVRADGGHGAALRGQSDGRSAGGVEPIHVIADEGESVLSNRSCVPDRLLDCSIAQLRERLSASNDQSSHAGAPKASFMVRIGADTNEAAEKELERYVSKESFARMHPVGQFNLGFIIAKCDTDLFLVDQHASDEKYNFERLQRTAQPRQQPLVVPQQLSLPAGSEQVVMDNLAVFEQSGFRLQVSADAEPTRRLRLVAAPASKSWTFGAADIEEMVYMLAEAAPGQAVRPTRLRAMFASRACRSSIMIGRALNRAEMRRLLRHMSEMEQPWNCPHGRPTMRHLFDLTQVTGQDGC